MAPERLVPAEITGGSKTKVSDVSRHLLLAFAAELIGVTTVAYSWLGWSLPAGVAAAIGLIVLVRWLVVLGSFALSALLRRRGPPLAPLGVGRSCRLVWGELWAVTKLFFVLHPLAPWLDRPDPPPTSRLGMPVLLVHGFFSNGGFWLSIKRWLCDKGISNLHTVTLQPVFADMHDLSAQLGRRVEQICAASGGSRVILVAHSMGGLVCRAYLRDTGTGQVAGLVTLGSPHQGTVLARLLPGRNVSQMRWGNAWLAQLEHDEAEAAPVPAKNIYSHHDNIVAPQDSAVLAWADNVSVTGVGHLAMAFADEIKQQLGAQLTALGQRGADSIGVENQAPR